MRRVLGSLVLMASTLVLAPAADAAAATDGGYVVDGFGGLHPFGGAPRVAASGYWPGWDIARGVVTRADGASGYVLDGYGGLHPFGGAPRVGASGYWPGWDIASGIALRADGASGYVLDGYGGLHPFGAAPRVAAGGYWPGWDIARGVALDACNSAGTSGWVLDGYGGLHAFGGAPAQVAWYLPGVDLARGVVAWCESGAPAGYTLDGWGRLHPFGAAPEVTSTHWPGWDIARGVVLRDAGDGGWVLDGWGGVHPFGGAPAAAASTWWPGWDIARGLGSGGSGGGGGGATAHPVGRSIHAVLGAGAWVDVFDWTNSYTDGNPTVGLEDIDAMAAAGMRTLFIQAARVDSPTDIVEPTRLAPLLARAHQRGMAVCAWYLPGFGDVAADQRRIAAIAALDVDCVGIDIEPTSAQTDDRQRNANLVTVSRFARAAVPSAIPLAGIVLPPVVTDILNRSYWPDFPWSSVRSLYDVWMPMSYWTNRTTESGWRDAYRYTTENVNRLRANLRDPGALVNAIGGIGHSITAADIAGFRRAAIDTRCTGLGIYDWASTPPTLRGGL